MLEVAWSVAGGVEGRMEDTVRFLTFGLHPSVPPQVVPPVGPKDFKVPLLGPSA